jgi:hypothetical protein
MKTSLRVFFVFFLFTSNIYSQKQNKLCLDYIKTHKDLAIKQMNKYKIPASITLAQGILESGAGTSYLAAKKNNHFGIKCGSDWTGKTTYHDDDLPGECFRWYDTKEDSYEDHSLFLRKYPRYSALFNLKITDYSAWAKGLQNAGYATSRGYANSLITIVETYELYQYDSSIKIREEKFSRPRKSRQTYISRGLLYLEAEDGDSYEEIAYDIGIKANKLLKFNDIPSGFPLKKGDIIYLESKKIRADLPALDYIVKVGDSMHSISQKYGIRLKSLYRLNRIKSDYIPAEGDVLRLR